MVPSSRVRASAASRSRRGRAWAGWSRRGRAWAGSSGPGGWSCLLHRGYLVSLRADLWSRLLLYKSSSVTIQVDVHEQCRFADCTSKTDDNLQTLATEQHDGGYVVSLLIGAWRQSAAVLHSPPFCNSPPPHVCEVGQPQKEPARDRWPRLRV